MPVHCQPSVSLATPLALLAVLFAGWPAQASTPYATYKQRSSFYIDQGVEWPGAERFFRDTPSVKSFCISRKDSRQCRDSERQPTIPLPLIKELQQLPNLDFLQVTSGRWTREAFQALCQVQSLRRIDLGCSQVCEFDFHLLANLGNLEELRFETDFSPRCFITLAKLPRLKSIEVMGYGDHFPHHMLSPEIKKAIVSLNGRLEKFIGDGPSETDAGILFGPGVIRELIKIKSLKVLTIDSLSFTLTVDDALAIRALDNLVVSEIPLSGDTDDGVRDIIYAAAEDTRKRRMQEMRSPSEKGTVPTD